MIRQISVHDTLCATLVPNNSYESGFINRQAKPIPTTKLVNDRSTTAPYAAATRIETESAQLCSQLGSTQPFPMCTQVVKLHPRSFSDSPFHSHAGSRTCVVCCLTHMRILT